MLVTGGILVALVGFAAFNPSPPKSKAGTEGLAQRVAAELVRARQRALATHSVVAVGFASAGGSRPHSQALYVLEGENPRLVRVLDLSREFPGVYLSVGHYPSLSAWQPGGVLPGQSTNQFDLAAWPDPTPQDKKLFFTAAGTTLSRLPRLDGNYQLVVSQGVSYSPFNLFGESLFSLTQVHKPATVQVSPLGHIATEYALPEVGPGVVSVAPVPLAAPPAPGPAPPPVGPPVPDLAPVVTGYYVHPSPNPNTLPPGVDCTLSPLGKLSAGVYLDIPDGERAIGKVKVYRTSDSVTVFYDQREARWNPAVGKFEFAFEFKAPLTDPPGEVYKWQLNIQDPQGQEADWGGFSGWNKVALLDRTRVIFESNRNGNLDLYSCNPDGTQPLQLTDSREADQGGRWSPDGRRFLFHSKRSGAWGVYVAREDGGAVQARVVGSVLAGHPPAERGSCWSPDGTRLAVPASCGCVYAVSEAGVVTSRLYENAGGSTGNLAWHPGGRWLVCWDSGPDRLVLVDTTGVQAPVDLYVDPQITQMGQPAFSSDGNRLLFSYKNRLYVADFAPVANGLSNLLEVSQGSPMSVNQGTWAPHQPNTILCDLGNGLDDDLYLWDAASPGSYIKWMLGPDRDSNPHWVVRI